MRRVIIAGAFFLTALTAALGADDPPDNRPPERPDRPLPERLDTPNKPLIAETDFEYSACLLGLYLSGATYQQLPAIRESNGQGCGILRPLQISQILPGVVLEGTPIMRCETARQLGQWLRDFVIPATRHLPGQPRLTTIQPGSTYQCRDRIGDGSAQVSEHGSGSAFDIMSLGFQDGSSIAIMLRQGQGDMLEAFQHTIQSAACLYFTTVLGPGSNSAHGDHLHLDIKARNGGYRLCQ